MNTPHQASAYSRSLRCLLTLGVLLASAGAIAQSESSLCSDVRSGSDYRTSSRQARELVELYHFTPEVEALIRGKQSTFIAVDLSYTLGAFPNHHRALMSMMLLGQKLRTQQPPRATYSVECYFHRALSFRPDDTTVRMMYASFLSNQARTDDARKELSQVSQVAGNNAFIYYNLGQVYFDLKDYDKALENAHRAFGLGLTLTGLRNRLTHAGHWRTVERAAAWPAVGSTTGTQVQ